MRSPSSTDGSPSPPPPFPSRPTTGKRSTARRTLHSAHYAGFVAGDSPSSLSAPVLLATAATAASGVGVYAIAASGATDPDYSITFVAGTLAVTPAPLTVTADDATKVYGQVNPAFTASYGGFVLGQGPGVLGGSPGFVGPAVGAAAPAITRSCRRSAPSPPPITPSPRSPPAPSPSPRRP